MRKTLSAILIGTILLAGCSTTGVNLPASAITDLGKDATDVAVNVGDEATAKQALLERSRQVRDKEYQKAYALSGLTIENQIVELGNGVKALLPMKLSWKDKPDFGRAIPDAPPDHAFWAASKSWVHDIVTGAVVIYGIQGIASTIKTLAVAKGATTYNGPVKMDQSQNDAGTSQTYTGPAKTGSDNVSLDNGSSQALPTGN
jgi:outer membrane murein-binding lipoprotein Lpp